MCRVFVGADPELWTSHTRSIRMEGMVTSVRLENMFWSILEQIADRDGVNVPQLLHQLYNESIDEGHDLGNFTSFLRVCCLRFLNLQLQGLIPGTSPALVENLSSEEILRREADHQKLQGLKRAVAAGQH